MRAVTAGLREEGAMELAASGAKGHLELDRLWGVVVWGKVCCEVFEFSEIRSFWGY